MDIFRHLNDLPECVRGGVVTVGKFDGLHLGHAAILSQALATSRLLGVPSVLFTFDPSPAQVLRPENAPTNLCDLEQKIELCRKFGIDALILYPTTRDFLLTSPQDFFEQVIVGSMGAVALVEGQDFCFGCGKQGDNKVLARFCEEKNIKLTLVPPFMIDGEPASSSAIRVSLSNGDVERAASFLGRPYRLCGRVESGDRRGRTLGFPTANLGSTRSVVPSPALYAAIAKTPNGRSYPAAVNIGGNPTFGIEKLKIEAHLLDFSGDLYGSPLELDFLARLRGVKTFESKDALLEQMRRDVEQTRAIAANVISDFAPN